MHTQAVQVSVYVPSRIGKYEKARAMLRQGISRKEVCKKLDLSMNQLFKWVSDKELKQQQMVDGPPEKPEDMEIEDVDIDAPLDWREQDRLAAIRLAIDPPGYKTCEQMRREFRKQCSSQHSSTETE